MANVQRQQKFVDRSVQAELLFRMAIYWVFSALVLVSILICWRILFGPSRDISVHVDYLWFQYKPVVIASLILLPLLLFDMLRVSNRFAGPMIRLRRAMERLSDGEKNITPLNFRENDFWQGLANDFNRLLESQSASATEEHPLAVSKHERADTPKSCSEKVAKSSKDTSPKAGALPGEESEPEVASKAN